MNSDFTFDSMKTSHIYIRILLFVIVMLLGTSSGIKAFSIPEWPNIGTDDHWRFNETTGLIHYEKPLDSAFTIRTTVEIQEGFTAEVRVLTFIQLHNESSDSHSMEQFRLVLLPDPHGWGGIRWNFRVESDVGFFSSDQLKMVATVSEQQPIHGMDLAQVIPTTGDKYKVALSYSPHPAVVSISILNERDGTSYFKGTLRMSKQFDQIRVNAGMTEKDDVLSTNAVHFKEMSIDDRYFPVATEWNVGVQTDRGTILSTSRIDFDQELVVSLDASDTDDYSTYRLVLQTGDGDIPLGRFGDLGAPSEQRFIPGKLPYGNVVLRLELMNNGEALIVGTRTVGVGLLTMTVDEKRVDMNKQNVTGVMRVMSQIPVQDVDLEITATIVRWEWEAESKSYVQVPFSSHSVFDATVDIPNEGGLEIPYTVHLPQQLGTWELKFSAGGTVSVDIDAGGGRQLFSTSHPEEMRKTDHVDPEKTVRICTYNMYDFHGWPRELVGSDLGTRWGEKRLQHFADVIKGLDCDVLGVQEGATHDWLKRLSHATDLDVALFYRSTVLPGAVFTKHNIVEERDFRDGEKTGSIPYSRTGGAALVDIDGRLLWIVNIHAHPSDQQLRNEEAKILGERIDELIRVTPDVIVLGDFNSLVGTVIHNTLRERGFLNAMEISGGGLVSTMNSTNPRALDHIYVSSTLIGKVRSSHVISDEDFAVADAANPDRWVHSDHLPVIADIELK